VSRQLSQYSDSLRAGRCGDRIPVGGEISRTRPDRLCSPPTSYIICTGSFPGVKRPVRDVDHPSASSAEVKKRVELYLYSPSGPTWAVPVWPLPLLMIDGLFFISVKSVFLQNFLPASYFSSRHPESRSHTHHQASFTLWTYLRGCEKSTASVKHESG